MAKVTLDKNMFKALASETRLNILKNLDGKKMNLKDVSDKTKLNKATLHEHLSKLHEAGLIKRKEREGQKLVYYKLTWKGNSLLHPENSRILVMFSTTFLALFFGIVGFIYHLKQSLLINQGEDFLFAPTSGKLNETYDMSAREIGSIGQNPMFLYITIGCLILFTVLMVLSLWRYKKNKTPKL